MERKIFSLLFIVSLILIIPPISAQEFTISEKADQRSVQVEINEDGEIQVKHVVRSSSSAKQLGLLDGTIKNLSISDEDGNERTLATIGDTNTVLILPSNRDSVIKYQLEGALEFKNDYWTLDFLYLESTTFIMPENLESIYVNDRIINLGEKRGFVCHGCQMVLEYSYDEPSIIKNVKWEDREFDVEIISFTKINELVFDQPSKSMTIDVDGEDKFLTVVIPLELLWEPYTVISDNEKIVVRTVNNNGTHVWLNMRPDTSGEISIIGTTVVPEFPIIAPLLVAGFLLILALPLVKKLSLHHQNHKNKIHIRLS